MSTDGNKKENSNEISRTSKALGKIFMAPANFVMDKLPSSDKVRAGRRTRASRQLIALKKIHN